MLIFFLSLLFLKIIKKYLKSKKEKADKSRRKSTFTKMEELTSDVKLLQNIAGEDGHLKE